MIMTFNTDILNLVNSGKLPINALAETPFYKLDKTLRKANLAFQMFPDEQDELIALVAEGVQYFIKKYGRTYSNQSGTEYLPIFTADGSPNGLPPGVPAPEWLLDNKNVQPIPDWHFELVELINSNTLSTLAHCPNIGLYSVLAKYIMYQIIISKDKNFFICSSKTNNITEFVDKIKQTYQELPFYLKPGVVAWNKKSLEFDNGCSINSSTLPDLSKGYDYIFYVDAGSHADNYFDDNVNNFIRKDDESKVFISGVPEMYSKFGRFFVDNTTYATMEINYLKSRMNTGFTTNENTGQMDAIRDKITDAEYAELYNLSYLDMVKSGLGMPNETKNDNITPQPNPKVVESTVPDILKIFEKAFMYEVDEEYDKHSWGKYIDIKRAIIDGIVDALIPHIERRFKLNDITMSESDMGEALYKLVKEYMKIPEKLDILNNPKEYARQQKEWDDISDTIHTTPIRATNYTSTPPLWKSVAMTEPVVVTDKVFVRSTSAELMKEWSKKRVDVEQKESTSDVSVEQYPNETVKQYIESETDVDILSADELEAHFQTLKVKTIQQKILKKWKPVIKEHGYTFSDSIIEFICKYAEKHSTSEEKNPDKVGVGSTLLIALNILNQLNLDNVKLVLSEDESDDTFIAEVYVTKLRTKDDAFNYEELLIKKTVTHINKLLKKETKANEVVLYINTIAKSMHIKPNNGRKSKLALLSTFSVITDFDAPNPDDFFNQNYLQPIIDKVMVTNISEKWENYFKKNNLSFRIHLYYNQPYECMNDFAIAYAEKHSKHEANLSDESLLLSLKVLEKLNNENLKNITYLLSDHHTEVNFGVDIKKDKPYEIPNKEYYDNLLVDKIVDYILEKIINSDYEECVLDINLLVRHIHTDFIAEWSMLPKIHTDCNIEIYDASMSPIGTYTYPKGDGIAITDIEVAEGILTDDQSTKQPEPYINNVEHFDEPVDVNTFFAPTYHILVN